MATIKGKIIAEYNEQSGLTNTGKSWRRKNYVIETIESYPKKICLTLFNGNIESLNLQMGSTYEVEADIEGREFEGKWYHSINAWKATKLA